MLVEFVKSVFGKFLKSDSGNFAVIGVFASLPILATVGMAVDYSYAVNVKADVQAAMDNAVLAGLRSKTLTQSGVDAAARSMLSSSLSNFPKIDPARLTANFTYDASTGKLAAVGTYTLDLPIPIFANLSPMTVQIKSSGTAGATGGEGNKILQIAMVMDATNSMNTTLASVKTAAANFTTTLNSYIASKNMKPFDMVQIRPIFFRDWNSKNYYSTQSACTASGASGCVRFICYAECTTPFGSYQWRGQEIALNAGAFSRLPAQASTYSTFLNSETPRGGGDIQESGLVAVNAAIESPWLKPGDTYISTSGVSKKADTVVNLIMIYTDADTHAPNKLYNYPTEPLLDMATNANSYVGTYLNGASYPTTMPNSYAGLLAKWTNGSVIPQGNNFIAIRIVPAGTYTFYADSPRPALYDNYLVGWKPVTQWPGYIETAAVGMAGADPVIGKIAAVLTSANIKGGVAGIPRLTQ